MPKPEHPLPDKQWRLSFGFGQRYPLSWRNIISLRQLAGRQHQGDDYAAKRGTKVKGPIPFKIRKAGWAYGYGKLMVGRTLDGKYDLYFAHLKDIGIKAVGKVVNKGQVFAWVNSTGNSTADHLHFEVRLAGSRVRVNPTEWLRTYSYQEPEQPNLDKLRSSVNAVFRMIFERNPSPAENDYYLKRIKPGDIETRSKLIDVMKYWKSRGKTMGK